MTHGLDGTVAQLDAEPAAFRDRVAEFIDGLVSHFLFDAGKLAVAHAGMKDEMLNRSSGKVREFALYGETTGETDEFGFPVRYDWASEYRGEAMIVYGHTPVAEAQWVNGTICIDTGCVFRRQADRVALSGEGTGFRAGGEDLLPGDRATTDARYRGRRCVRRRVGHRRRARQTHCRHAARPEHHRTGGKPRRRRLR